MAPPAPVRFTTAIGWPRSRPAISASLRARRSAPLPAPNSTVSSTGLVGKLWPQAAGARARSTASRTVRRVIATLSGMKDDLDGVADSLLDDLEALVHVGQRERL